jgi:23S rRNA (uracil1939-C5)-methyltransferase
MPLAEIEQRQWKRTLVREALRRIGQAAVEVDEVRTSPVLAYRNKVEFTLGRDPAGRPVVGLHSGRSDGALVDVDRCAVQHDDANAVLASARTYLLEHAEEWVDSLPGRAEPYRLVIRRSWWTGEILVALRETARPFPAARGLAEYLAEAHGNLVGVVRIQARKGRRGGTRISRVLGRTWLDERIGETTFRLPAASFFQINTYAAAVLLDVVVECVGPVAGRRVADLYAGVGAFGIELARRGANVTLCETDRRTVHCGRRAARAAASQKITFARAEVSDFLKRPRHDDHRFDVIVANPPRSGMDADVPRLIGEHRPARIVLVSCDPATLARDTRRLTQQGYAPERVVPIDLFPQTAHVETVLVLRQGAAGYRRE